MPPNDQSPITFQDPLPDSADVVVIGAGVIGIATAWFLREKGISVLVCDKGRVAGEQSSRNWGWIRQQGRDPDELPIVIDSVNTWETLSQQLQLDIGFTRQGVLYAASDPQQLAEYEQWLDTAQQHQLDTRMLSSREVDALVKDKPGQWCGGMFTPSDGRAEPFKAVGALATALHDHGGVIRENCAVRSIATQAGSITAAITEHGLVKTNRVVLAGGAWSSVFLANLGINLPQLTVRATVARTAPTPNLYDGNASLGEICIRRRQDGGYTIASSNTNEHLVGADSFRHFFKFMPALRDSAGYIRLLFGEGLPGRLRPQRHWQDNNITPFETTRVLNPTPSARALDRIRRGLKHRLPQLGETKLVEAWAGMIDVTPDVVPVMDQIPQQPGLFVATGFSGHGFGIGPGAGRVMANLVAGQPVPHNMDRFRFSRFSDGSAMRPGPGL